jgi:hypothetical protein
MKITTVFLIPSQDSRDKISQFPNTPSQQTQEKLFKMKFMIQHKTRLEIKYRWIIRVLKNESVEKFKFLTICELFGSFQRAFYFWIIE